VVAGVAVLLLAGRLATLLVVQRDWYESLGAERLWLAMAGYSVLSHVAAWTLASLFIFANLYGVRRSVVSVVLPRRVGDLEIGEEVPRRFLTYAAGLAAVALGALLAIGAPSWTYIARAIYGVPFGEADPAFGYDLGFYVYWLPLEKEMYEWALICTAVVIVTVLILYALTPSLRWERGRLRVTGYVRKHVTLLGSAVLAMLAWSHRLDAYGLLIRGSGVDGAFTYADRHLTVTTDLLLALLTLSAAIAVFATGWLGQVRLAFGIMTVAFVTSALLRMALPPLAGRLAGGDDPETREAPFTATRAAYTRRAYSVDVVSRGEAPRFASAADALTSLPAWEPVPLRLALERSGSGVVLGDFGWRADSTGVFALAIDSPSGIDDMPDDDPWRLVELQLVPYTYTSEPPTQPVRGQRTERNVAPVYLYPGAEEPLLVEDPNGGVIGAPFDTFMSRLTMAWSQQNFRLLRNPGRDDVGRRMITRRDVLERVAALAPGFLPGRNVSPIVTGDSIWWAATLYSASESYPLAESMRVAGTEVTYLRHAATALVNAHSGLTLLVAVPDDRLDPIARSWMRRFPELFVTADQLPAALGQNLPVPMDAMLVKAVQFARLGARGETIAGRRVPYDGADSIAAGDIAPGGVLDGNRLYGTVPVVDSDDRLRGVVLVYMNGEQNVSWIPLEDPGISWTTAVARLRRWSDSVSFRGDARIARGAVRVIPTDGGPLLVQSFYRWRPDASPTIAGVAVLQSDRVTSLAEALATVGATGFAPRDSASFTTEVARLYQRMRAAMQAGDWPAFGAAYDSLGLVIRANARMR
jgi:uncharacterized protein